MRLESQYRRRDAAHPRHRDEPDKERAVPDVNAVEIADRQRRSDRKRRRKTAVHVHGDFAKLLKGKF
jgi:hypothetical protein